MPEYQIGYFDENGQIQLSPENERIDISDFIDEVEDYYVDIKMPEQVREFLDVELAAIVNEYNKNVYEIRNDIIENTGLPNLDPESGEQGNEHNFFIDAYLAQKYMINIEKYCLDAYNAFVPIYNIHLSQLELKDNGLKNLLSKLIYADNFNDNLHYYFLGRTEYTDYKATNENHFYKTYNLLYDELIKTNSPEVSKTKALEIMKEAIREWLNEVYIDYVEAYQSTFRQNIKIAQELGLVYNNDAYNTPEYYHNQPNITQIDINNIVNNGPIFHDVNAEFHAMLIDSETKEFRDSEDVVKDELFQTKYIDSVLDNLDVNDARPIEDIINYLDNDIFDKVYEFEIGGSGTIQQLFNKQFSQWLNYLSISISKLDESVELKLISSWIYEDTNSSDFHSSRHLNYVKVPYIELSEDVSHKVKRNISYIFSDGSKAADEVVQEVEFKGVKSLISNETTWEVESLTLPALENPTVSYLNDRVKVLEPLVTIDDEVVTPEIEDINITIVYPLAISAKVFYHDEDGNEIKDSKEITGSYDVKYSEDAPTIEGYEITSANSNVKGKFNPEMNDITFVYEKDSVDDQDDNGKDLPITGQSIMPMLVSLILASSGGMIYAINRRKVD